MRIPLTKYGMPEVIIFPAIICGIMACCFVAGLSPETLPSWIVWLTEALLLAVLLWCLSFFRDPARPAPDDKNILLAPADGKITDIETVQDNSFIETSALRIGIFLSIFDAHINRLPCRGRIEKITYNKGKYKNAMNPESGRVNESNDIAMARLDSPQDRLLVRQISGAIARRIVCDAQPGQELACGQKFGMIKFGSRCELYVPWRQNLKCLAKTGDKVKAGLTVLARYE